QHRIQCQDRAVLDAWLLQAGDEREFVGRQPDVLRQLVTFARRARHLSRPPHQRPNMRENSTPPRKAMLALVIGFSLTYSLVLSCHSSFLSRARLTASSRRSFAVSRK